MKRSEKNYYLVNDSVIFFLLCDAVLVFLFVYFQPKLPLVCLCEFGDNQQELLRVSV